MKKTEIIIYQTPKGVVKLNADFRDDTIWATQAQISELFDVKVPAISKHVSNIYQTGELDKGSTVSKMEIVQTEGDRKVTRSVDVYNLDMVLSIGYRVNSTKATEFRKWANKVLKEYLLKGVAINQNRLDELNKVLEIVARSDTDELSGVANVLKNYTSALHLLSDYDENKLQAPKGTKPKRQLTYDEARELLGSIDFIKTNSNFAKERNDSFRGILGAVYQSFDGVDLYKTVEEKAANLLYLIVKDHPFVDGNKRSAAALFVYFLDINDQLRDEDNQQIIAGNTLAAITLMAALSKPAEKSQIVLMIMNLMKVNE